MKAFAFYLLLVGGLAVVGVTVTAGVVAMWSKLGMPDWLLMLLILCAIAWYLTRIDRCK